MNQRRIIITSIAMILVAAAVIPLAAAAWVRTPSRHPYDPSLLVAGDPVTHAAPGASADNADCTGSAGFWAPVEDDALPPGARRLECKRYV